MAASAILRRLGSLDLSMGNLSDDGAAAMAAAKLAFMHLDWLNLEDNALTDHSRPLVRGLAKRVIFGDDHHPDRAAALPGERYVSVGE